MDVYITIPLSAAVSVYDEDRKVKTAISLPELVRQTNSFSKKYRPGCAASLLDSNPKALFLHYNVRCNKTDSDPAGHDVRVQFDVTKVEETQQAKDLDIQVSCSCPAFLYWGAQWNLHQRDSLLGPRARSCKRRTSASTFAATLSSANTFMPCSSASFHRCNTTSSTSCASAKSIARRTNSTRRRSACKKSRSG